MFWQASIKFKRCDLKFVEEKDYKEEEIKIDLNKSKKINKFIFFLEI